MKYVLLKLEDDAAERLVRKAGPRALGVWEVITGYCSCEDMYQTTLEDWIIDPDTGRPKCRQCGGYYKPLVSFGQRLKTFLGRNLVKKYR